MEQCTYLWSNPIHLDYKKPKERREKNPNKTERWNALKDEPQVKIVFRFWIFFCFVSGFDASFSELSCRHFVCTTLHRKAPQSASQYKKRRIERQLLHGNCSFQSIACQSRMRCVRAAHAYAAMGISATKQSAAQSSHKHGSRLPAPFSSSAKEWRAFAFMQSIANCTDCIEIQERRPSDKWQARASAARVRVRVLTPFKPWIGDSWLSGATTTMCGRTKNERHQR